MYSLPQPIHIETGSEPVLCWEQITQYQDEGYRQTRDKKCFSLILGCLTGFVRVLVVTVVVVVAGIQASVSLLVSIERSGGFELASALACSVYGWKRRIHIGIGSQQNKHIAALTPSGIDWVNLVERGGMFYTLFVPMDCTHDNQHIPSKQTKGTKRWSQPAISSIPQVRPMPTNR